MQCYDTKALYTAIGPIYHETIAAFTSKHYSVYTYRPKLIISAFVENKENQPHIIMHIQLYNVDNITRIIQFLPRLG